MKTNKLREKVKMCKAQKVSNARTINEVIDLDNIIFKYLKLYVCIGSSGLNKKLAGWYWQDTLSNCSYQLL